MLLLLAAALPTLVWDAAVDTAPALRDAGITHIAVPAVQMKAWEGVKGITVEGADLAGTVKLDPPAVDYRANRGGATSAPWITANGWQFLRKPDGRFYYDTPGAKAALAAAEAYCYRGKALIRTDTAGLKPLAAMLEFLRSLPEENAPPVADIGFVDDGSENSGEVLNLMTRGNLLYRVISKPASDLKVTVKIGTPEYSEKDAENPATIAHLARTNLTDDRRSLRIYGSQVVLGHLTGAGGRMRVYLINYDPNRKVNGIRVRVLGRFEKHALASAGSPGEELTDFTALPDATEFTLPELKSFAVIDLTKK